MQLHAYSREIRFALTHASNLRSLVAFLAATAAFHLRNLRRDKTQDDTPRRFDLTIGGKPTPIVVRPRSGDLFILYEVLAFESYNLDPRLVDPARVTTIVDCGANIGMTALYFAAKYPRARIISVEPDPENFKLLRQNTAAEPRIEAVQAAMVGSPTREPVFLSQDQPSWGNVLTQERAGTGQIEVPAVTLNELCERFAIETIDILKVDIEGAEEAMFRRATWLDKVRFIVIELHGYYQIDRFRQDVEPAGFTVEPPGEADAVIAYRVAR